jgi:MraZ protein
MEPISTVEPVPAADPGPWLIGYYEHSLDDKGRVTLPVKFRSHFQGPVLLADLKQTWAPCIRVYTPAGWRTHVQPIVEKLEDFDNPKEGMRRRRIYNAAFDVEVDKQGRVLVPATMIDCFGLQRGGSVVVAGNGSHLEIWNPEAYDRIVIRGEAA